MADFTIALPGASRPHIPFADAQSRIGDRLVAMLEQGDVMTVQLRDGRRGLPLGQQSLLGEPAIARAISDIGIEPRADALEGAFLVARDAARDRGLYEPDVVRLLEDDPRILNIVNADGDPLISRALADQLGTVRVDAEVGKPITFNAQIEEPAKPVVRQATTAASQAVEAAPTVPVATHVDEVAEHVGTVADDVVEAERGLTIDVESFTNLGKGLLSRAREKAQSLTEGAKAAFVVEEAADGAATTATLGMKAADTAPIASGTDEAVGLLGDASRSNLFKFGGAGLAGAVVGTRVINGALDPGDSTIKGLIAPAAVAAGGWAMRTKSTSPQVQLAGLGMMIGGAGIAGLKLIAGGSDAPPVPTGTREGGTAPSDDTEGD